MDAPGSRRERNSKGEDQWPKEKAVDIPEVERGRGKDKKKGSILRTLRGRGRSMGIDPRKKKDEALKEEKQHKRELYWIGMGIHFLSHRMRKRSKPSSKRSRNELKREGDGIPISTRGAI